MAETEDIENLYRKRFAGKELPVEEDEWALMSKRLDRHDFFTFSFNTFNIYFVGLGILIIIALFFFLLTQNTEENNIHSTRQSQIIDIDSTKENIPLVNPSDDAPQQKQKSTTTKSVVVSSEEKLIPVEPPLKEVMIDTAKSTTDTTQAIVPLLPPVKKKKFTRVIQQDTITQNDTTWVNKKNKRK